jgi:uncharacterized Zn finger protein
MYAHTSTMRRDLLTTILLPLQENRRQQEKFRKDCEDFERKKIKMESEFDIRMQDLKTEWRSIEG